MNNNNQYQQQQQYTTYNGYPNYNSNNNDINSSQFGTVSGYSNNYNNQNWVTPSSTNKNNNGSSQEELNSGNSNNSNNYDNRNYDSGTAGVSNYNQDNALQPQATALYNNNLQTPQYAQPNTTTSNNNTSNYEKSSYEKFPTTQHYFRDLWALLLYLLVITAFFIVLGLNLYKLNFNLFSNSEFLSISNDTYIISLAGGIILSLLVSGIYLMWMLNAPGLLIRLSYWFNVLLYLILGLFLLSSYSNPLNLISGIMMLITAIIYIFLWFSWKNLIPFSTLMLQNITKFILKHPSVIIISFGFLIFSFLFYSIWLFTLVSVLFNYSNEGCEGYTCNSVSLWFLIIFLLFVIYWTSQLLKDILHLAISGTFASDYFFPNQEKFPILKSLGRALSTSLGSACFGSLLIAIVQSLRSLASFARGQDNGVIIFVGCCLECLLSIFEGLLAYFNIYAYTYCSMYGQSYLEAGKSTWNLVKSRGIEAIINDSLISNVLNLGSFIVGGLSSLVAIIVIVIQVPQWQLNYGFILVILINWTIGKLIFGIVGSVLNSCNISFFVCLAEDPMVLRDNNPDLYEKIRTQYPQVEYSV